MVLAARLVVGDMVAKKAARVSHSTDVPILAGDVGFVLDLAHDPERGRHLERRNARRSGWGCGAISRAHDDSSSRGPGGGRIGSLGRR